MLLMKGAKRAEKRYHRLAFTPPFPLLLSSQKEHEVALLFFCMPHLNPLSTSYHLLANKSHGYLKALLWRSYLIVDI
eukprot:scaffold2944_cov155-Skeletonema_dohrnii-CCMP3373.AAC.41